MTVESSTSRAQYATNGTTGPWTVPFYFLDRDELGVTYRSADGFDTLLTLDVHYSVTGEGDEDGGTVTTTQAYPAGGKIVILRDVQFLQATDYVDGDGFPAETHERALDRLTMIAQQLRENASHALRLPAADSDVAPLPSLGARRGMLLSFDSAGNPAVVPLIQGVPSAGILLYQPPNIVTDQMTPTQVAAYIAKTGTVDHSAAFQAVVNASVLSGTKLVMPAGLLVCNSTITVNGALVLEGAGRLATKIRNNSTTNDLFRITSDSAVEMRGIWLSGSGSATAGRLISLNGSATMNAYSVFRDMLFEAGWEQFYVVSALSMTIDSCIFSGFKYVGITIQNVYNADAGDSSVKGCQFGNASTALACIRHLSSGGLRLLSNKYNTAQYGYLMQCSGVTADLLIDGSSFENNSIAAMAFSWVSGSYNNVKIGSNQIALTPTALQMNSSASFLSNVSVAGLVGSAIGMYGMLFDNIARLKLGANQLVGSAAAGSLGLLIGDGMGVVDADPQQIVNFERRTSNLSATAGVWQNRSIFAFSSRAFTPTTSTVETFFPSATCTIPLNCSMVTSGMIRAIAHFGTVNTAGTKTLRAYVGGVKIWEGVFTTVSQIRVSLMFGAAFDETNQQVTTVTETVDGVAVTPLPLLTSVNMSIPQTLTWTYQKSNAADALILYTLSVEAITQG